MTNESESERRKFQFAVTLDKASLCNCLFSFKNVYLSVYILSLLFFSMQCAFFLRNFDLD